jgi:Fur family transcriptional regulator, ferric uptake regulator
VTPQDRELVRTAFGAARASVQRAVLARAAGRASGTLTAEDLAARARREDSRIGLATVYRAIPAMLASGWLERVGSRDGHALYAHCAAAEHHHHLVCTGCGAVQATPCPVERHSLDAAAEAGFVITHHEVTVYGLCRSCLGGDATAGERGRT